MELIDLQSYVPNASRKIAILDTNLLILHIAYLVDPSLVFHFKRTRSLFTAQDAILLAWTLRQFRGTVTTSYVLTESSNLGNGLTGEWREAWFSELAAYARRTRESHISTSLLGNASETTKFGFADSALTQLSKEFVVITAEHRLSGYLERSNAQVLNFNHLRPLWMMG